MNKHRLCAVSYLNTKPFLYGLLRSELGQQLEMETAIPSECARKLKNNEIDIALVPVAILAELSDYEVISDFCIGTVGAVKTVCIYGNVPIEEMDAIYLDHHSRTSAMLTRLLLKEYWKLSPQLLSAKAGYIDQIDGNTGGLVIGDRAIGLEERFDYVYDLGEIWMKHTALPFVFAAWVSSVPLSPTFKQEFNSALKKGLDHIPELQLLLPSPKADFSVTDYFTHYISYQLDNDKKAAMQYFLNFCTSYHQEQLI